MILRKMEPRDVRRCLEVRTSVRENSYSIEALRQEGITEEAVATMLATTHRGWVGEIGERIVGFSIGNRSNGEFWVIAVLPEFEGRGIGRQLMEQAVQWLRANACAAIWLRTSPDISTRAYGFYRKFGWQDCSIQDGQRVMKLRQDKA